ncbi:MULTISPECIES: NAD(P)-binding protein [unclassified Pseudomonas]|uniref:NAD(P)-binding protein n=1 Tax=unclassified Pseudomonas TaxID=196821 RepID=UPI000C86E2D8|nr:MULTISPECIES: FAD/NAD(P)-binding protein [unclassified Pseudomonas]PMV26001.1 spermidine dehydrogenase [Pseudomonas sp. FW305-3-2-15-C-TSA2]PMV31377.1 spermidine dehydrogenase [Pseudomonas sp. DP16D-L5]PMV41747.1 spermidine dehydrogenase [Pseudomonas sp. FW305-3-2-15-A-LB2]PMV46721.1 spermidine dehydrogenase [Pseudomonas sp. FW305-3-2-15-C-R2A1]PMV54049.1 spermidine dehydrogenase [Pseudomonas sp. FW305-3-2-15-C-LB1]
MDITRRDFLNGVAVTLAAGMTPLQILQAAPDGRYYPPALTGLRGSHAGSFEVAHQMGWEKKVFDTDKLPVTEDYDLVVVGGGLSGLSAAWFYREKHPKVKILILENHDDFGGHAKRNEFQAGGRMIIGYGGSEAFQSPNHLYSKEVNGLLKKLGVNIKRFETAFDRRFYPGVGLSRGVFFDKENFGEDKLVTGDPTPMVADDIAPDQLNARAIRDFINDFPLPAADRQALIELHTAPKDYLPGKTAKEKADYLAATSYRDFLLKNVGLSEGAVKYFQSRTNDFMALSIDAVASADAYSVGFPGFAGMNLAPISEEAAAEMEEPYIYHFPDGNASVARLLVRSLIPGVAPGHNMDDIVLAAFDYARLDQPKAAVRLRLNSTAVSVRNVGDGVHIGYSRGGQLAQVRGKRCILACYNMMIPYLLKDLPAPQAHALSQNVKYPLVYTKVVIRNWQSFQKLGVHEIYAATQPYSRIKLDYPVSMGGYDHPRDPTQPIGLHMVYVPTSPNSGMNARDQARAGRGKLYGQTFEQLEAQLRDQLQRMLGPGGFNHETDILAITVNRWSHGYASFSNSLFDQADETEAWMQLAKKPVGHVSIANSDAAWSAYAHAAIDEAYRAVGEVA